MSLANEVNKIPLSKLAVHPMNRQIYVNDPTRKAELLESIKEQGILEPLIVMPQGEQFLILSGARRFDCARELGLETAPCIVTMARDPVLAIIEHNKYRQKTPIEIYNEAQLLRKILEPKAKEQQGTRTDLLSNLTKSFEPINTRQIIAEKLNVSSGYLAMLEEVYKYKDKIPDVIKRLDAGRETVYSAYNQLRQAISLKVEIPGIFIGRYFAGKHWMAKDIIARIPKHHCYVEPFGGFCSVLLNKASSPVEVFNDVSKDVVNFILCLRDYSFQLISELYLMPYSRWLLEQYMNIIDEPFTIPDVERAAKWFYLNDASYGSIHEKRASPSWGYSKVQNQAMRFRGRINTLLAAANRLLGVQIENRDYSYVLERYDSPDTFFYVDPPYYETDDSLGPSFDKQQHEELKRGLEKLQGMFLLTYNECPEIRKLYQGFHVEKVVIQKTIVHPKDTDGLRQYYTQLMIMNYELKER